MIYLLLWFYLAACASLPTTISLRYFRSKALQVQKLSADDILSRSLEKRLWEKGFAHIIGVDEAGRGSLAGPVVVTAISVHKDAPLISKAGDSKSLSEKVREEIFEEIINDKNGYYLHRTEIVAESVIDEMNIQKATLHGMQLSTNSLCLSLNELGEEAYALIDGNVGPTKLRCASRTLVHGDTFCYPIALASILAKVTRDHLMVKADMDYPVYGFAKHKGYGTKAHIAAIHKYGPCLIHRRSFKPVKGRDWPIVGAA